MKTVIVLSLLSVFACTDQKKEPPVDQTRTTSAIILQPTLRDGHAAEPNVADLNRMNEAEQDKDMDVDETDMSGGPNMNMTGERDSGVSY
jgi:hypothetical protein